MSKDPQMDAEAIQSDLFALKKLYGLLIMNHHDEVSETLDASSRLFLKKLLDAAAGQLFDHHCKMIMAEPSAVGLSCFNEQEKYGRTPRLYSVSKFTMNTSPLIPYGINNDLMGSTRSQTSKKLHPELNAKIKPIDLSSLSSTGSESQTKKKLCRACQRRNMQALTAKKQMNDLAEKNQRYKQELGTTDQTSNFSANKTLEGSDAELPPEFVEDSILESCKYKYNISDVESVGCSVRCVVREGSNRHAGEQNLSTNMKNATMMDHFSDVVVRMKRIENLIRSLRHPTKPDNMPYEEKTRKLGVANIPRSDNAAESLTSESVKRGVAAKNDPREANKLPVHEHDLHVNQMLNRSKEANLLRPVTSNIRNEVIAQKESREDAELGNAFFWPSQKNIELVQGKRLSETHGWSERTNARRIESLSCSANQDDSLAGQTPENIQGLRLSQFGEDQGHTQTAQTNSIRDTVMYRSPTPAPSVGSTNFAGPLQEASTSDYYSARIRARERNAPQMNIQEPTPTASHASHSRYKDSPATASHSNKKGNVQRMPNVAKRNKVPPYNQHSEEETSRGSSISSSWTSQPSSPYASSSRTFQSTSSGSSESDEYELSSRRFIPPYFSSSSGRIPRYVVHESSSEHDVSSDRSHNQRRGRQCQVGRIKSFKSSGGVEKVTNAGRLRRIKNKLGMIFHHHHHHHHDGTDEDEAGHAKSLWRHLCKMFQHKREKEPDTRRSVEKKKRVEKQKVEEPRRPAAKTTIQRKQQGGHFHALVEGLMRHVRHKDKSKVAKDTVKRPGHGHRGGGKVVNGFSLWQKFHGQHGVKLSKSGRMKLGSKRKRPQLSMGNMRSKH